MFKIFSSFGLSNFGKDIAIDLGTATTLVYIKGEGIIATEPSVVAINQKTGQVLAIGEEAKKMVGRTPMHITASRPLVNGVISDFEVAEQMLKYFIEKAYKRKTIFPRPRVIIGIPCGLTEVEKKSVRDAALNAGAGKAYLVEQPIAAAIGARMPIQEAGGNFIVDIGGGTTDIAVISLGGIVLAKSLKVAGDKLDTDIIDFCQEEYRLLIGTRTAEKVKIKIGSAYKTKANTDNQKNKTETPIRGRNLITGLPEEVMVGEANIRTAINKSIKQIISTIKDTVENTPPELVADIMSRGICLAGGGSMLRGLDELITKETKIPTKIIEDPLTAVVRGAGMILENLDELEEVLIEKEEFQPPKQPYEK
ncbi:rod shape-determining protein [Patescibacteria group bacterium]|nr:rod shape-determining protein [Patescibacteria group bacterium]MBU4023415.1 rod shape-determining protein [Patescibacteria group bacterium]MBU4078004.1 rod shape-determining protein [Patescibacteria group bacterium]